MFTAFGIGCFGIAMYYAWTHQESRLIEQAIMTRNLGPKDEFGNVKPWKLKQQLRTSEKLVVVFEIPPGITFSEIVWDEQRTSIAGALTELFDRPVDLVRHGRELWVSIPNHYHIHIA